MRRFVARRGEDIVYTTFAVGARDSYEDVAYTADPSAPTIKAIRSDGGSGGSGSRTALDQTGEVRAVDVEFLVASESKDTAGNVVTFEDVTTKRAATVTDADGRIYKVLGPAHEGVPVGARRLLCMRQAD